MGECLPNRARIAELTKREEQILQDSTPKSRALYARAVATMPKGVASSYQSRDPYPIYISHGKGSRVYNIDGQEKSDFHNGFGCMVQGHAHPAIVEAVHRRMQLGSQFGMATEDQVIVAEHLARNFRLPKWRFVNSGSEATMDAIRIARAFTGRDTVLKVMGSYHGHHDYVMVSVLMFDADMGPRDDYRSLAYSGGQPDCTVKMTVPVPFNDVGSMRARIERLIEEGRKPACLIMEPAMMFLGIILPQPGYLEAVRELTKECGIVLIFDEVKTGITTAPGGAVERFGVVPDIVCLAKAIAAGLPAGAIGGTDEIMELVATDKVYQVGTYNGNPLCMAAARASLEQVMTPEAYAHLDDLNERLMTGVDAITRKYDLPFHTVGIRSKGVVIVSGDDIVDYESFVRIQDPEFVKLAWLYAFNRKVLTSSGRELGWVLSVQHTDEDVARYLAFYEELLHDVLQA